MNVVYAETEHSWRDGSNEGWPLQPAETTPWASGQRLRFPDGLRGVAALMVVFFHLHLAISSSIAAWVPSVISRVFENGNLGVEVFFVLSGFVIAQSTASGERSLAFLGRFGLRRSIRLDPPMWAAIALELFLIKSSLLLFPDLDAHMPTASVVMANAFYLQRFLGFEDVLPVLWSLTYEVQFYIVLVVGLIAAAKIPRQRSQITSILFVAMLGYSALVWTEIVPLPLRGLFIDRWYQFALGIAVWRAWTARSDTRLVVALLATTAVAALFLAPSAYRRASMLAAVLTGAVLLWAGISGRMGTLLSGRVIQFFGAISYSLYLVHGPIGWRFIALCQRLLGTEMGPLLSMGVFAGATFVSVLAAWTLYRMLEVPSVRLAQRIRLPKQSSQVA